MKQQIILIVIYYLLNNKFCFAQVMHAADGNGGGGGATTLPTNSGYSNNVVNNSTNMYAQDDYILASRMSRSQADKYPKECSVLRDKLIRFAEYNECLSKAVYHNGGPCQQPPEITNSDYSPCCAKALIDAGLGTSVLQTTASKCNERTSTANGPKGMNYTAEDKAIDKELLDKLNNSTQMLKGLTDLSTKNNLSAFENSLFSEKDFQNEINGSKNTAEQIRKRLESNSWGEFESYFPENKGKSDTGSDKPMNNANFPFEIGFKQDNGKSFQKYYTNDKNICKVIVYNKDGTEEIYFESIITGERLTKDEASELNLFPKIESKTNEVKQEVGAYNEKLIPHNELTDNATLTPNNKVQVIEINNDKIEGSNLSNVHQEVVEKNSNQREDYELNNSNTFEGNNYSNELNNRVVEIGTKEILANNELSEPLAKSVSIYIEYTRYGKAFNDMASGNITKDVVGAYFTQTQNPLVQQFQKYSGNVAVANAETTISIAENIDNPDYTEDDLQNSMSSMNILHFNSNTLQTEPWTAKDYFKAGVFVGATGVAMTAGLPVFLGIGAAAWYGFNH